MWIDAWSDVVSSDLSWWGLWYGACSWPLEDS